MKRQEGKKNKWLIPVICLVALLALLGTLAAVFLPMIYGQPASIGGFDGKLYWNVERETYKTGKFFHRSVGDDRYRLLFAVEGQQVQLDVQGKELVTYIDTMDMVALEFDENGIVVDAKHPEELGLKVTQYYVESVNGDQVTLNSNYAFRAMQRTVTVSRDVGVYAIKDTGPLCGLKCQVSRFDEIQLVEDADHNVVAIFNKPYQKPGDIYWNVDKLYDSVNKRSTRQPNDLMQYDIDFIVNGQPVTLRCKDPAVVDKIDAARITGLVFDENNYIVDVQTVKLAANGGKIAASNYYVTSLNFRGGQYRVRNKALIADSTVDANYFPTEDMVVYDMTGNNGALGQLTDIRVNDRVIFILDCQGRISIAFITNRSEDPQLYWNVDRKWNKTTLRTNRVPDGNGWYYFKMAIDGKHVTVKTDDLDIANAIEKPVCVGLQLDGDVVKAVVSANKVYPGGVFASWLYIKEIGSDGIIVAERTVDGVTRTETARVAADCRFYNTSTTAVLEGETISLSQLKVGDTIHGYKNFNGDIAILYLVGSTLDGPIYWNVDKNLYWDATNKTSTRTPDENGYYNILLAVNGKQVTMRTRNKSMVDDMDNRTCMALRTSGDIILKVFSAVSTANTKGGLFASSYYVTAINGNTITATKLSGTDAGNTESRTMSWNCQVYNVSNTATLVGEKSSVQVGDQIRCLLNESKQISVLYVLSAANHGESHLCDCCGETPVWLAWDGSTTITKSGHYVLNGDITAAKGIDWNEEMNVTLCLNGHTLTVNDRRVLGDVTGTMNIVDCVGTGAMHGTTNNNASITMVNGGVMNIFGGTYTAQEITEEKNGGLFTIIDGGQINMYGGTISGGKTNGYGGNVNISDGTFTLNGGVVENGTSATGQYGGNFALSGDNARLIVNGGTICGGHSGSYGGNIAVAKTGAMVQINGGLIRDGIADTHGGNLSVALGKAEINSATFQGGTAGTFGSSISLVNDVAVAIADSTVAGGQLYARNSGGLTLGGKLTIDELYLLNVKILHSETNPITDSTIGITMEFPGVFMENAPEGTEGCFASLDSALILVADAGALSLVKDTTHKHCVCVNAGTVPENHTCTADQIYEPITASTTITQDGAYYLDFAAKAAAITVADGVHAKLCLNGATIYAMNTITLGEGSTLDICDCSQGMTGVITRSGGATRSPVSLDGNQTINLYSGSITGTNGTKSLQSVVMNHAGASFHMYGGTIRDGKSASYGGNLAIVKGVFTMYAGTITGGEATTHGGNITASGGSFIMKGGLVTGGTATTYGGNISFVTANSSGVLTGGSITGGTALSYANCVYVNNNNVTIGGSAVIAELMFGGGKTAKVSTEVPFVQGASVGLALQTAPTNYATVIKNFSDLSWFACTMENFILDTNGDNIVIKPNP